MVYPQVSPGMEGTGALGLGTDRERIRALCTWLGLALGARVESVIGARRLLFRPGARGDRVFLSQKQGAAIFAHLDLLADRVSTNFYVVGSWAGSIRPVGRFSPVAQG